MSAKGSKPVSDEIDALVARVADNKADVVRGRERHSSDNVCRGRHVDGIADIVAQ